MLLYSCKLFYLFHLRYLKLLIVKLNYLIMKFILKKGLLQICNIIFNLFSICTYVSSDFSGQLLFSAGKKIRLIKKLFLIQANWSRVIISSSHLVIRRRRRRLFDIWNYIWKANINNLRNRLDSYFLIEKMKQERSVVSAWTVNLIKKIHVWTFLW